MSSKTFRLAVLLPLAALLAACGSTPPAATATDADATATGKTAMAGAANGPASSGTGKAENPKLEGFYSGEGTVAANGEQVSDAPPLSFAGATAPEDDAPPPPGPPQPRHPPRR